jgi:subtilisin family serine protease
VRVICTRIDSGVATGHPDLSGRIEHGWDLIGRDQEKGWQEDLIGTGTHHAALIAGRDDGTGIVGLAPEAGGRSTSAAYRPEVRPPT